MRLRFGALRCFWLRTTRGWKSWAHLFLKHQTLRKSLEHLRIGSWVLGLGPWAVGLSRQSQMPRLDTGEELDVLKAGQLGSLSRADGYRGVLKHSPTNQPLRSWMQDII